MAKIGFIGSGKMAEALIKAILKTNLTESIISSDKNKERLDYIMEKTKIKVTRDNKEVVKRSDVVFLAVKPSPLQWKTKWYQRLHFFSI